MNQEQAKFFAATRQEIGKFGHNFNPFGWVRAWPVKDGEPMGGYDDLPSQIKGISDEVQFCTGGAIALRSTGLKLFDNQAYVPINGAGSFLDACVESCGITCDEAMYLTLSQWQEVSLETPAKVLARMAMDEMGNVLAKYGYDLLGNKKEIA